MPVTGSAPWASLRALWPLALLAGGCASSGAGAEPGYVVHAPPTTSRVLSEQAFLDEGFAMELAEQWDAALQHYATVINGTVDATPRLTAQSALRAAMCHLAVQHEAPAAELLEGIVRDPYVAPDEDYPAAPGGAGAALRLAAESRLTDIGGDPAGIYAQALAARDDVLVEIAIISLARIGTTFGKQALEAAGGDAGLAAEWRELAARELTDWGSRKR